MSTRMIAEKTKTHLPFRVLVALHLSQRAGQLKLSGLFNSGKTSAWNMTLLRNSDEFTPGVERRIQAEDFDGIIASTRSDAFILDTLANAECPVVTMDLEPDAFATRKKNLVTIRNDETSIARAAVRTFDQCGQFADFAFIPHPTASSWSNRREKALKFLLSKRGLPLKIPQGGLRPFLSALKAPTAILTANDETALKVLDDALAVGRAVPDELSVLGIDNDTMICENARIPLSSIEPDFAEEGRAAADLLDEMMRSARKRARRNLNIGIRQTVLRESTHALPPAQKLIERAERLIAEHATFGLTPKAVAARLGVSRPLLDLRLRQFKRPTLQTLITDAKFAAVLKALRDSDRSFAQIANDCGFPNPKSLGNIFRRRMGVSMSEWLSRTIIFGTEPDTFRFKRPKKATMGLGRRPKSA